jgi:hypothetical protein
MIPPRSVVSLFAFGWHYIRDTESSYCSCFWMLGEDAHYPDNCIDSGGTGTKGELCVVRNICINQTDVRSSLISECDILKCAVYILITIQANRLIFECLVDNLRKMNGVEGGFRLRLKTSTLRSLPQHD